MIELRWMSVPIGGIKFINGRTCVLQYRFQLPRHPGFILKFNPQTGETMDAEQWSDWKTVEEVVDTPPLPEAA